MRKTRERARGVIDPGDIIVVEGLEYGRPYTGKQWRYNFWTITHAWRVDDITNNGKIHAHDANGQRHVIHALDSPPARYIKRIIKGRRPA